MKRPSQKARVVVARAHGGKQIMIESGGTGLPIERDPDFVYVDIEEPDTPLRPGFSAVSNPGQKGTIFLGLCLGTVAWNGKRGFAEFDGFIRPAQLDTLIHNLTLAREEAARLGLVESPSRARSVRLCAIGERLHAGGISGGIGRIRQRRRAR